MVAVGCGVFVSVAHPVVVVTGLLVRAMAVSAMAQGWAIREHTLPTLAAWGGKPVTTGDRGCGVFVAIFRLVAVFVCVG